MSLILLGLGSLLSRLLTGSLLGEKVLVDVGQDTSLGNGDSAKKLVELLIVADGKLKVTGVDAGLLVVAGGVSGKLKNLSGEVLEDSSEVDGCSSSDTAAEGSLLEETVDATHGELKSGAR